MLAKYFPDTDALLLQFSDREIAETYDLNEDVLVETDKEGRVIAMTIEHAKRQTNVNEFAFQFAYQALRSYRPLRRWRGLPSGSNSMRVMCRGRRRRRDRAGLRPPEACRS